MNNGVVQLIPHGLGMSLLASLTQLCGGSHSSPASGDLWNLIDNASRRPIKVSTSSYLYSNVFK